MDKMDIEDQEEEDNWVPDFNLDSIGTLTNVDMTGKDTYIHIRTNPFR